MNFWVSLPSAVLFISFWLEKLPSRRPAFDTRDRCKTKEQCLVQVYAECKYSTYFIITLQDNTDNIQVCVCVTLQDSAEQETCKIARLNESDKLEVCIVHTLVFSIKEQQLRVTVVASDCILQ